MFSHILANVNSIPNRLLKVLPQVLRLPVTLQLLRIRFLMLPHQLALSLGHFRTYRQNDRCLR